MAKLPTLRQDGNRLQRIDDIFTWDPFSEIANVRRTMNSLLDSAMSPASGALKGWMAPAIDLYEKDGKFVVEAAIPGLQRDDIDIEIAENRLTLSAKMNEEKTEEKDRYHYREVRRGGFARTITFPADIDADKVEAEYQNGIVRVTVPTVPQATAKKVQIKG